MTSYDSTPCPVCGGLTLAPATGTAPLLAVADYLVSRVLRGVDDLLTRGRRFGNGRAIQNEARGAGGYVWTSTGAPPAAVDKAIGGRVDGWRIIALIIDDRAATGISARQVQAVLSDYVHDLVADRRPHTIDALRQKLHADLGLVLHADALQVTA